MKPNYCRPFGAESGTATDDDDESKLVGSTKQPPAVKRLGKVLEQKRRLNSTINNRSKRIHNMSKSFRRQTLQENNRNLARALQKYKERQRFLETQIVDLKREKQDLSDELSRLRQVVGKKDIELNSIVEERVEKRLSEIRQAASQLMELSSNVVSLCLGDKMNLTGRPSSEMYVDETESGSMETRQKTVELSQAAKTSMASDLSLITEVSFLDQSGFASIQFADEPNYLQTVTEVEESRRSRSRSCSRSRRSELLGRSSESLLDVRHRSRSASARSTEFTENKQNLEKHDVNQSERENSKNTEMGNLITRMETENKSNLCNTLSDKSVKVPTKSSTDMDCSEVLNTTNTPRVFVMDCSEALETTSTPHVCVLDSDDSRCDISASEYLRLRFPGGDKIARTPPRTSSIGVANTSSNVATPHSGENTPKYDAFNIPLVEVKVANSFTPTRSSDSPKVLKKSANTTFSFIPLDNAKPPVHGRVQKLKKTDKAKPQEKRRQEAEAKTESESKTEVEAHVVRRRTYSLENSKVNFSCVKDSENTDLNATYEKDEPDVLPRNATEPITMETVAMEAVAREAASVVEAMSGVEVESLDDSLGVLDDTVLEALDMEMTAVIPGAGIVTEQTAEEANDPADETGSADLDPVDKEKGLKRPRHISPQNQSTKKQTRKQRKTENVSSRNKENDSDYNEPEVTECRTVLPPVDQLRNRKSAEELQKISNKPQKEQEKAVFKIPVVKSRTKSSNKTVAQVVPAAEEYSKRRARRTTVVKSYKEHSSGDEESPVGKKKREEIDPADRRKTKIIRRVSTLPKPAAELEAEDVIAHVIDDTVLADDVTMTSDVSCDNDLKKKEVKTYSQMSRRDTQVIRPNYVQKIDPRRQTKVIARAERQQTEALPAEDVTLPEPEMMPYNAAELEMEPEKPKVCEPEEEMTLDLTKLIKSINREKALAKAAQTDAADDMTLDLTKLLKTINREVSVVTTETETRPQTSVPSVSRTSPRGGALPSAALPERRTTENVAMVTGRTNSQLITAKRASNGKHERVSSDKKELKSRLKIARVKECKINRKCDENSEDELPAGKRKVSVDLEDISSLITDENGEMKTRVSVGDDITPKRVIQTPEHHVTDDVIGHMLQTRDENRARVGKTTTNQKAKKESEVSVCDDENNPDPDVHLSYKMRRDTTPDGWKKKKKSSRGGSKRSGGMMKDD